MERGCRVTTIEQRALVAPGTSLLRWTLSRGVSRLAMSPHGRLSGGARSRATEELQTRRRASLLVVQSLWQAALMIAPIHLALVHPPYVEEC